MAEKTCITVRVFKDWVFFSPQLASFVKWRHDSNIATRRRQHALSCDSWRRWNVNINFFDSTRLEGEPTLPLSPISSQHSWRDSVYLVTAGNALYLLRMLCVLQVLQAAWTASAAKMCAFQSSITQFHWEAARQWLWDKAGSRFLNFCQFWNRSELPYLVFYLLHTAACIELW